MGISHLRRFRVILSNRPSFGELFPSIWDNWISGKLNEGDSNDYFLSLGNKEDSKREGNSHGRRNNNGYDSSPDGKIWGNGDNPSGVCSWVHFNCYSAFLNSINPSAFVVLQELFKHLFVLFLIVFDVLCDSL